MVCPFGINNIGNNFKMFLQFTNYKSNHIMNSFYEFIQNCEYKQMELLGLTEEDSDLFVSQIKHDSKEKYDPNLEIKLPPIIIDFNVIFIQIIMMVLAL